MKKIIIASSTAIVLIFGLALMNSCQKEEETDPNYVPSGQEMVLGEGKIAYSIENMQRALDSAQAALAKSFPGARLMTEEINLRVNNKYVRFLPKDSIEHELLMEDSTLNLFNYPIDKPILQNGTVYEPEYTNENGFSWLYSVVPLHQQLPEGIQTEVIEEVFIPDYGKSDHSAISTGRVARQEGEDEDIAADTNALYAAVEAYALYLAGQMDDEEANEMIEAFSGGNVQRQGGTLRINSDGTLEHKKVNTFIEALKGVKNALNMIMPRAFAGSSSNSGSSPGSKWCVKCLVSTSWRPEGDLFIEDPTMTPNRVPLRGIKVMVHRHLRARAMYTDDEGHFESDTDFSNSAYYTIHFKNRASSWFGKRNFRINSGKTGWSTHTHRITGKTKSSVDYTYTFTGGSPDNFNEAVAAMYLAAEHYYFRDVDGIDRPKRHIRIWAKDEHGDGVNGSHSASRYFFLRNQLHMFAKSSSTSDYRDTDDLMATMFHELAHSTHYVQNSFVKFGNIETRVKESWARGVQYVLTRKYFPSYNIPTNRSSGYTGLVRDLIDTTNSVISGDMVSGYTLSQIENTLIYTETWEEWEQKILQYYENDTENEVSDLFDYWE